MRSGNIAATIAIALFAGCGGAGYGDYDDDGDAQDSRTDDVQVRDGGGWDAQARDGGARADGGTWSDGGGGGSGSNDDDDDGDDEDATADAGSDGGGADAGADEDACETLTYQSFGRQFISNYCASCHGGASPSGGVSLSSLANVVRRKAGVKAQVESGGMPLGNKQPSDEERERFGAWIDCGPK